MTRRPGRLNGYEHLEEPGSRIPDRRCTRPGGGGRVSRCCWSSPRSWACWAACT